VSRTHIGEKKGGRGEQDTHRREGGQCANCALCTCSRQGGVHHAQHAIASPLLCDPYTFTDCKGTATNRDDEHMLLQLTSPQSVLIPTHYQSQPALELPNCSPWPWHCLHDTA
jgi:hypothetical protein